MRRLAVISVFAASALLLGSCGGERLGGVRVYEEIPAGETAGELVLSSSEEKEAQDAEAAKAAQEAEEHRESPGTSEESEAEKLRPEQLYVYVCGEVNAPGVYEFAPGSRCYEAVERAGGFTAEADPNQVNLALPLEDGQKLCIPAEGETVPEDGAQAPSEETSRRININTASKEQLTALPGIGDARAESIIAYREAQGGFDSIEQIQEIEGIKEKMYLKLKDYITVE